MHYHLSCERLQHPQGHVEYSSKQCRPSTNRSLSDSEHRSHEAYSTPGWNAQRAPNHATSRPRSVVPLPGVRSSTSLPQSTFLPGQDAGSRQTQPNTDGDLIRGCLTTQSDQSSSITDKGVENVSLIRSSTLPSRPKTTAHELKVTGQHETAAEDFASERPRCRAAEQFTTLRARLLKPGLTDYQQSAAVTVNARSNTRRRPCVEAQSIAPPKLRRDTECTDAIVKLIVCFSTKLVHTIWSQSSVTPKSSSAFNGAGVLPLQVFIQETLRRSKTSYSTLQVALYYLILLKPYVSPCHQGGQDQPVTDCRALQCGRRMFLAALILASKYLQDRNYSSRAWSKISGLPIAEINENERRYLGLINFDLHMKKETFENWSKIVLTICKVGNESAAAQSFKRIPRSCTDESLESPSTSVGTTMPGSESWWTYQLHRLTPDLVADSSKVDEYLASLLPSRSNSDVIPDYLNASLDTPPSSPDSIVDASTDNGLLNMVSESSPEKILASQMRDFGSSPSSAESLPSRPYLPNLPTPQTTPRHNHMLPWPKRSGLTGVCGKPASQNSTCSDKQSTCVANLSTCPPPRPRAVHVPHSMPALPDFGSMSAASGSLTSSPDSMVSDVSSCTTRSRSSSISSNSSVWWPSGSQSWPDETRLRRCETSQHANSQGRGELLKLPAIYNFYHSAEHSSLRSEDDGYGSTGYISAKSKHPAECEAADILASLRDRVESDQQKTFDPAVAKSASDGSENNMSPNEPGRRPKRGRSSISTDNLHEHVRQFLWSEEPKIHVVDAPYLLPHGENNEKLPQYPAEDWACPKKPAPNGMRTKRLALQHNTTTQCKVPSLTSNYLRDIALVN